MKRCSNCFLPISGNHCSNCGQRTSVEKVTFSETFQDINNAILSLDAPLVKSIGLLFYNPGKLFRNYLSGQRRKYYKPVSFFILTTIVYLVIRSLIGFDPSLDSTIVVNDQGIRNSLLSQAKDFMFYNIDKFLFLFVFTLTLLLKTMFFRRYSLAEFFAVSFYVVGFYTLMTTLTMFFVKYLDEDFQFVTLFLMIIYFIFAMISFLKRRKLWIVIGAFISFVLAFVMYILLSFGIFYLVILFKNG